MTFAGSLQAIERTATSAAIVEILFISVGLEVDGTDLAVRRCGEALVSPSGDEVVWVLNVAQDRGSAETPMAIPLPARSERACAGTLHNRGAVRGADHGSHQEYCHVFN